MNPISKYVTLYGSILWALSGAGLTAQTTPALPPPPITAASPATTASGSGEFHAIMEADPGLPTHTIYRPADLHAPGLGKLPVVLWGNGACANAGNRFRFFLSEIASYGYIVVAVGPIDPSVNPELRSSAPPAVPGAPHALPPPATHSAQLIDGLNWITGENERTGSVYYRRVDVSRVAVMGQSCGGVQAIEASADPRVKTSMIWNSGLLPMPTKMAGGVELSKDYLKHFHAPVAYISGDGQDVAYPNANDDFERLSSVPVFRAYERGVPHLGTYSAPNGGEFAGVAVAWLNWQLMGNKRSALMFTGPDCGLCVNPRWVVQRKGL